MGSPAARSTVVPDSIDEDRPVPPARIAVLWARPRKAPHIPRRWTRAGRGAAGRAVATARAGGRWARLCRRAGLGRARGSGAARRRPGRRSLRGRARHGRRRRRCGLGVDRGLEGRGLRRALGGRGLGPGPGCGRGRPACGGHRACGWGCSAACGPRCSRCGRSGPCSRRGAIRSPRGGGGGSGAPARTAVGGSGRGCRTGGDRAARAPRALGSRSAGLGPPEGQGRPQLVAGQGADHGDGAGHAQARHQQTGLEGGMAAVLDGPDLGRGPRGGLGPGDRGRQLGVSLAKSGGGVDRHRQQHRRQGLGGAGVGGRGGLGALSGVVGDLGRGLAPNPRRRLGRGLDLGRPRGAGGGRTALTRAPGAALGRGVGRAGAWAGGCRPGGADGPRRCLLGGVVASDSPAAARGLGRDGRDGRALRAVEALQGRGLGCGCLLAFHSRSRGRCSVVPRFFVRRGHRDEHGLVQERVRIWRSRPPSGLRNPDNPGRSPRRTQA